MNQYSEEIKEIPAIPLILWRNKAADPKVVRKEECEEFNTVKIIV